MKKIFIYALGLAALTTSCNNNNLQEQALPADEVQTICATIKDFDYDQSSFSRTSISIEEDGPHYAWATTDTIGIFPDKGRQVEFSMAGGAGSTSATFTGGGWGLKSISTYAAYYPLIGKYYLDKTAIPVDYTEQLQDGNGTTTHLGAYDYLAAPASEVNNGTVSFNFERLGCLVRLIVTIPEPATLSKLSLTCPQYSKFIEKGTVDLSANEVAIISINESQTLDINVSNITTTKSNEQVTIYLMTAPIDLSNKTLTATIEFEDGTNYETEIAGKNLIAGKAYSLEEIDKRLFTSSTMSIQPAQENDGTYQIKSAANMKWFMENCKYTSDVDYRSANYKLMTDIIMETPWNTISSFYGIFDGNNKKIINLKTGFNNGTSGLFGTLNGTVKNLIFENPEVSIKYDDDYYNTYCGALAGEMTGGSIINCGIIGGNILGTSTSRATCHIGGFVGFVSKTGVPITIKGCYVNGAKIIGDSYWNRTTNVGAICGSVGTYGGSRNNIHFMSCYTHNVTINSIGNSYGSFLGCVYLDDNTTSTITACYYDDAYNAIGFKVKDFTTTNFEALTETNFAEAIRSMNTNLTDCDYIFGEDGSFVKRE